ncbi:MAG TPA: CoA ester lyase [Usitatibacter sp.]|nr:CoA ester lyase [Usitatibacter sp.]
MSGTGGQPIWRSMMFVPVNVERFVEGAHRRGADAIILDLEDSILPKDKEHARTLVAGAAPRVARSGADVLVRLNRPWRLCVRDLEAVAGPAIAAVMLPKTESAEHVRMVAEVLDELEAERGLARGHTRIVAMIETAEAFFRAREIAAAHARVVALTLGSEDFALSVGMVPEAEGLFHPKQQIVLAARAAGVMPLGFVGTVADYKDLEAFRATVRRSRRLGFMGSPVIHPSQIPILNEEFRPSAEEVEKARRVVAAFEAAAGGSAGAIEVDGKMVDYPVVERARRTLERHEAIEKRAASAPGA